MSNDSRYTIIIFTILIIVVILLFAQFFYEVINEPLTFPSHVEAKKLAKPVIKEFEGLRLEPYQDGRELAICYGHHGGVKSDWVATEEQCEAWLDEDINKTNQAVSDLVAVQLNAGQRAALISFAFAGRGRLARSDFLPELNKGNYDFVEEEIPLFIYGDMDGDGKKEVLPGLKKRREEELRLWRNEYDDY